MKLSPFAVALGLCIASLTRAAEPVDAQIKLFQQTVTAAFFKIAAATPGSDRRNDSLAYATSSLAQFTNNNASSNPQELERVIMSLVALTQNDPAVVKAADTLLETVKADKQTRVTNARNEMDMLLKKAGDACLSAKIPADLDAILVTLAPYGRSSGYERRIDDQESWQRGANAYRFVTRWQDYLGLLNQGNDKDALNILRDLASSVDTGLMPRSRIVALLTPESPKTAAPTAPDPLIEITAKLEKAKTSEDLIAIARVLNELPRKNQYQPNPLPQALSSLVNERQQVIAGTLPYNLFTPDSNISNLLTSIQDATYTLTAQTALLSFRRETQRRGIALALASSSLPTPTSEEMPEAYLLRLTAKFAADDNWLQVRECLELYRSFFNGNRAPSWLNTDITACTAYLAARNLDLAEQYAPAVASYLSALRSAGRYTPVQAIGARLAELKKTNPEAFTAPASTGDDSVPVPSRGMPVNRPSGYGPSLPHGNIRPPASTGPFTPAPASTPAQPATPATTP